MDSIFNINDFVSERESKEIDNVTKVIMLMEENNISCKELSKHIRYTEKEVNEMYNYRSYNKSLVDRAGEYLKRL